MRNILIGRVNQMLYNFLKKCHRSSVYEYGDLKIVFESSNLKFKREILDEKKLSIIREENISVYKGKHKQIGNIILRKFPNNDLIIFFDSFKLSKDTNIKIVIGEKVHKVSNFEGRYIKPNYDNRYGEFTLSGPSCYVEFDKSSLLASKIYYHQILKKKYIHGESLLYDLIEESNDIYVNNSGIELTVKKNEKFDFTLIFSDSKLFTSTESFDRYFNDFYKSVKNNEVWNSFWVKYNGTLSKLPYSIEPFTKNGYGINIHHSSKKEVIKYLSVNEDRFYQDVILNAIYSVIQYQPESNGLYETTYTSTWLKKQFNIKAPYIDTRLNEVFLTTVKEANEYFNIKELENYFYTYGEFLNNYKSQGGTLYKTNRGVFFPDYFSLNETNKLPHASLNHQLGIAIYCYRVYEKNNNKIYLNLFNDIISFVEDTCEEWINTETGDLYYSVEEKENKYYFKDQDYTFVTLSDLLHVQTYYSKINKKGNQCIEKLIQTKLNYLYSKGYDFESENAWASGESSITIKVIKKLLEENNYTYMLKRKN